MHTLEDSFAAAERASARDRAWFLFSTERTYVRPAIPGEVCGRGCICIRGYDALIEVQYITERVRTRRIVTWVAAG